MFTLDLSRYTHGSCVIRTTNMKVSSIPAIGSLEDMNVVRQRKVGAGTYGQVFDARIGAKPCVMKMVELGEDDKTALNEVLIHVIVLETCKRDPEIRAKQSSEKMARVPDVYAIFRFTEGEQDFLVTVMEKLTESVSKFMRAHNASVVASVTYYQMASLFDRLGKLLRFNHRDMKLDNAMVLRTKGSPIGGVPHFQTYVLDFGCARLTYMDRTIVCNPDLYEMGQSYNEGHDLVYLAWSYRTTMGCRANTTVPCTKFAKVLDDVFRGILDASGLNFASEARQYSGGLTAEFYTELAIVGRASKLRRHGSLSDRRIQHTVLTNRWVKKMMVHVVRVIARDRRGRMLSPEIRSMLKELRTAAGDAGVVGSFRS